MLGIFQKIPVHIKIYPNEIEVTDLRTSKTIRQASFNQFSSPRMLVADFHAADTAIQEALTELGIKRKALKKVLFQYMQDLGGGICEVEKRALRDLGEQAGGAAVAIVDHTQDLSTQQALKLLR